MKKEPLIPSYLENNIANLYFYPHFTAPGKFVYFREQIKDGKKIGGWVEVDVFGKSESSAEYPEAPAAEENVPFPVPFDAKAMGAERFLYFNEKTSTVYFTAKGRLVHTDPHHEYVFKMKTGSDEPELLSKTKGHHQAFFSPEGDYFIDTVSQADQPPETAAFDPDGNPIVNICACDVSLVEQRLTYPLGMGDQWNVETMIFLPRNFEPNYTLPACVATGELPVSFADMISSENYYQAIADRGWLCAVSPRGEEAARELAEKFPFINKKRIFAFGEGETRGMIEEFDNAF